MKNPHLIFLTLASSVFFPHALIAQLLMQQYNETAETLVTTTASEGKRWHLAGTIMDLTQFEGTGNTVVENPFGWANWVNYGSVTVVDGGMARNGHGGLSADAHGHQCIRFGSGHL